MEEKTRKASFQRLQVLLKYDITTNGTAQKNLGNREQTFSFTCDKTAD